MVSVLPMVGKGIQDDAEYLAEKQKTRSGDSSVKLTKKGGLGLKEVIIVTLAIAVAIGIGMYQTKDW